MENTKLTVLVLIDFSNAFNTVDHDLLLAALPSLNLSPSVIEWFSSYLRERRQSVTSQSASSDCLCLPAGVPQGGILSPILFSIFINLITVNLDCSYHLYADDLQLYTSTNADKLSDAIMTLNANLTRIAGWSQEFGVTVNPTKCQALIVGSTRLFSKVSMTSLPPILFDGAVIPYCQSVRNLGLYMDSALNWTVHVSEVSRKVIACLRGLYRFKFFLPSSTKLMLVQTLVLPIIDYADVCYPDLTEVLLNKLDRLLNNCIRFVSGLRKYDHISSARSRLKWLPIRQRRNSRILCLLYSILNNPLSPLYLKDQFMFVCQSHDRSLRSSNNLTLYFPRHHSNFLSKSFTLQAARLWNALPIEIKLSSTKTLFKKRVHDYFNSIIT